MNEIIIKPSTTNENVIVQFSELFIINKNMFIAVPNQYKAIAYIDEKICFRVEPCVKISIVSEYGKEYIGKQLRVAFVLEKSLTQMAWGFGNIQVNNERLKEAYRAGANGKYTVKITDYVKLINAFSMSEYITIDKIREKTLTAVKTVGVPILGSCFASTDISVFEISSLVGIIREELVKALDKEVVFNKLGVKIESLTVDGVHVNEEDLEIIRNRINND